MSESSPILIRGIFHCRATPEGNYEGHAPEERAVDARNVSFIMEDAKGFLRGTDSTNDATEAREFELLKGQHVEELVRRGSFLEFENNGHSRVFINAHFIKSVGDRHAGWYPGCVDVYLSTFSRIFVPVQGKLPFIKARIEHKQRALGIVTDTPAPPA